MDEIKNAEMAIKQLKDYIELRKASCKMNIADTKTAVLKLAEKAAQSASACVGEIVGK